MSTNETALPDLYELAIAPRDGTPILGYLRSHPPDGASAPDGGSDVTSWIILHYDTTLSAGDVWKVAWGAGSLSGDAIVGWLPLPGADLDGDARDVLRPGGNIGGAFQLALLRALLDLGDGASVGPLAGHLTRRLGRDIAKAQVSTTLKRLAERSLVSIISAREGRRGRVFRLTPRGLDVLRQAAAAVGHVAHPGGKSPAA